MTVCIDYMLKHWRVSDYGFLSIIHQPRTKAYAVVNEEFLQLNEPEPGEDGTRIMLRCTLKELKKLCTYYHNTQTKMSI